MDYNETMLLKYEQYAESSIFLACRDQNLKCFRFVEQLNKTQICIRECLDVTLNDAPTSAKRLRILKCQLSELKNIETMELQMLDLQFNCISDISLLQTISSLQELYLGNNQISDIQCLTKLINVFKLGLQANQISNITCLTEMKNLQWLNLSYNLITGLSNLNHLKYVTYLHLDNCQISDIQTFRGLKAIKHLSLQNNNISEVFSLQKLDQLENLDISCNQIVYIHPLQYLTHLDTLQIYSNYIIDLQSISVIKNVFAYNQAVPNMKQMIFCKAIQEIYQCNQNIEFIRVSQYATQFMIQTLKNRMEAMVNISKYNHALLVEKMVYTIKNLISVSDQ
ncbi:leucine-rich_repeat domain-containing protein [Hexamita inflata]|uniref:Leucine-rich repeat domain-containing protein n=1 Tax=Hexamita inflata TaxID=28002 RepID=A0AA86V3B5_9EUKA|nr:leucine-rich repeat domain-containing protein [Hexamita inflata]